MNNAYKLRFSAIVTALALFLLPGTSVAQRTLDVGIGTNKTIWEVFSSIVNFLAISISSIAIMLFVVGAFMIMVSGVKEDMKDKGKNMIIGSLLSLAIVLGAYAILRTVDCFLTPSC